MIGRYRITDQLLDEFRRRLVTEEKSELTIAQYMRDVRDFCGFLQKGEPVDKEEAIAYKDHLVKTYRSSATVNTKLRRSTSSSRRRAWTAAASSC